MNQKVYPKLSKMNRKTAKTKPQTGTGKLSQMLVSEPYEYVTVSESLEPYRTVIGG